MITALLDGDIVAFRAAAVSETNIDWNDGEEGKSASSDMAARIAVDIANSWIKKAGAGKGIVCLTPPGPNFRKVLEPSYKANRTGEKPQVLNAAIEALRDNFLCHQIDGLEADDVMGILATNGSIPTPVIVTIDKDLQGIPGLIYNPLKDLRPRRIRPQTADFFWMYQTLVGDPVDGYKGCPGVGPVGAKRLLENAGLSLAAMWAAVAEAFRSANQPFEDALVQARLSRILRHPDYEPNNSRIKLWHPNQTAEYLSLPLDLSAFTPPQPVVVSRRSPKSSKRKAS